VQFHITLGWLLLGAGRKNDAAAEVCHAAAIAPDHTAVGELARALAGP